MSDAPLNLRRIFADICRGYTQVNWNNKPIYIKHMSHFEQVDIDEIRERFYNDSKRRGIPDVVEQTAYLEKEGLWTKQNQAELETQKVYLDNMRKTKSKMAIRSQIEMINKSIAEAEVKYDTLLNRKSGLIGNTAERYADQRMYGYYIYTTFYKDSKLEQKLFTEEEFLDLDDEEMDELMSIYMTTVNSFSHSSLKKVSIQDFFLTYLNISENTENFYGKPPCFLSFYQINLLSYGAYFKHIMEGNSVPDDIKNDPEKIEDYVVKAKNMKEMYDKAGKNGGSVGFVGASKEDLASLGPSPQSIIHKKMNQGNISTLTEAMQVSGT